VEVIIMAVNAATIWEFRATNGSNTNGGGYYNADPGTSVDYSNQNAAEESYTTLATSGAAATTVTCGGADTFDAGIAGNVIYIASGTNFVAGWYQVTVRNSATSVDVDRSPTPAGAGSDGVGNMGGALALFTDAFLDNTNLVVAGNTLWVKNDGTMTLTGAIAISSSTGSDTAQITIEGYNTSRGDDPTGTNRPLIACGENAFGWGSGVNNWWLKHLRFTTTEASGVDFLCQYSNIINCASNNSSGTGGRDAFNIGTLSSLIGCEAQSANGIGVTTNNSSKILSSYIHDCGTYGIYCNSVELLVIKTIIDTCTTGIETSVRDGLQVFHSTIYNCTTGISGSTGNYATILNNIIDACTTGVSWSNSYGNNYLDFNCWDNTTDVSNVTKGDNAVTGDPSMTDPANGDFSIPNNSNCVDAALDAGDYTDATV